MSTDIQRKLKQRAVVTAEFLLHFIPYTGQTATKNKTSFGRYSIPLIINNC